MQMLINHLEVLNEFSITFEEMEIFKEHQFALEPGA